VAETRFRALVGAAELRELLDPDVLETLERQLQSLDEDRRARSGDGLHDMLLRVGDLTREEVAARVEDTSLIHSVDELVAARRAIELPIAGQRRVVAVEDAARYRDALRVQLPAGQPNA